MYNALCISLEGLKWKQFLFLNEKLSKHDTSF